MVPVSDNKMDDELLINLHKDIQNDLFNWEKISYFGKILWESEEKLNVGDFDNWIETSLFISPKFAHFYTFIYKHKNLANQFIFKKDIPKNLLELREILIRAKENFKSGKLKKSELNMLSSISNKIIDYISWIMEDRGIR